jgi:hypothetical protein
MVARPPEALKAGLIVAELSPGKKLALIRDAFVELAESPITTAMLETFGLLRVL